MLFHLKYGTGFLDVAVDDENLAGVLRSNEVPVARKGIAEARYAMEHPVGTERLRDIVKKGERIAIITSDITRPMPTALVLPLVLEELWKAGCDPRDITVVFALGSHRKHTEKEKMVLMGEESYSKVRCEDSDPSDFVHMGTTSCGTPVDITRTVAEADRRICLGNIEYHYFAGYSGGAKAIMPGVSTRDAIQHNHSRMVLNGARAGNCLGNPVRRDIDEVLRLVPVDFIVNVVLDEHREMIKAVAGDCILAHREGCKFLDSFYKIPIEREADIVVVSAGGYPKDINLYQAQKALDNAAHAVRKGGVIILAAGCREGYGEKVFEKWIMESKTPGDLIERIGKKFELGGHKAAAIALVLQKCDVFLVSGMGDRLVKKIYMKPYSAVQTALGDALRKLGGESRVLVMPYGGSTLPVVESRCPQTAGR